MENTFSNLPLKHELLKNLEELKFHTMTPIQSKGLPSVLEGKDTLAQAKTGSGKTAVFGLGILNSLDIKDLRTQSLVLCPTRELAHQVASAIRDLARLMKNVKIITLSGGVGEHQQIKSLSYGAHIIVGTPGRVHRLLRKNKFKLDNIKSFILDEADRMLHMGFYEDIISILSYAPSERQSMLFSATFPEEIKILSQKFLTNPKQITVDVTHQASSIKQIFYGLKSHRDKNKSLLKVINKNKPERMIVFCNTKQVAKNLVKFLKGHNISADAIHGDLLQNERTLIWSKFSNNSLSLLVATDLAARGLDIEQLPAIVNYDLPYDPEVYVHRIGRTGRAGAEGMAISFFIEQESAKLDSIESLIKQSWTLADIEELDIDSAYEMIPPMTTLHIYGGKRNKLRPGDILGALVGEAKIPAEDIGKILIFDQFSYVAIKSEKVEEAFLRLNTGKIKNKKFKTQII